MTTYANPGETIRLTGNEFTLLKTLMSRPDRVFSRAELLSRVQGYEYDGYDRTIGIHVKNLRKKIAAVLPDQELIVTVYGIGYKLTSIKNPQVSWILVQP